MKRSRARISAPLVAAALWLVANAAGGEVNAWSPVGGFGVPPVPYVIDPLAVAPSGPSMIYAGVDGILMRSSDGGAHWVDVRPIPGFDRPVARIAVDPSSPTTVYVMLESIFPGGAYVYKSADAGAHWGEVYEGNYNEDDIRSLVVAPSDPSTIFFGSVNGPGVVRSIDGGATWTASHDGITPAPAYGTFTVVYLAVDPSNANVVYAAADAPVGLFKSTDRGVHWLRLDVPTAPGALIGPVAIDPATPSTIYAGYYYGNNFEAGLTKSIDGGATWTTVQNPIPDVPMRSLAIDPAASRQLYATTFEGVFRSTDGAGSWAPFNDGLTTLDAYDLAIDRTGTLLRVATPVAMFEYRFPAPASDTVPVIEYYHAAYDHYFVTAIASEIAALDSGAIPGWTRTGLQFNAYAAPRAGTSPVCRFYTAAFAGKPTHFYSSFEVECASLRSDPRWTLESDAVFDAIVPGVDGACAAGDAPVYRLYNSGQGGAPNHRYTSDRAVRALMIAHGWVPEGLGADGVQMCSPP